MLATPDPELRRGRFLLRLLCPHAFIYRHTQSLSLSLSLCLSLCSADYGYALLTPSRKRVVLLRCFLVACMVSRAREFGLGWSEPYNKTKLCFSPTFKDLSLSLSVCSTKHVIHTKHTHSSYWYSRAADISRGAFLFLFLFLFLFVVGGGRYLGRYYRSGDGLGWSCFGLSTERASKRESRPRTPSAREWKVVGG